MATEVITAPKTVVYDGDCPMCTSTIGLLLRMRLLTAEQTRAIHELDRADFESVSAAGIRNQLVVIDPVTREARSGTDGLLWILRENTGDHFFVRLLSLPVLRDLLRWGYQAISYNRRIISPPRHQIVCDCEPEVTLGRRLSLIVPLVVLSSLLAAGCGAAQFLGLRLGDASQGAVYAAIGFGAGPLALALASLILPRGKPIDYVGHLVVTTFVGLLIWVPASVLAPFVGREVAIGLDCLTAAASFLLMFAMQRRRVTALGISKLWLAAWVIAVMVGFGAETYLPTVL